MSLFALQLTFDLDSLNNLHVYNQSYLFHL